MAMSVFFELFSNEPHIIRIKAGSSLFTEGEEGQMMYVLTTGRADVMVNNQVVETIEHGGVVGEMGIVSPEPRSATVIATTDCDFVAIDEKRFHYLVQQAPHFATQVMRLLASRLRHANQMLKGMQNGITASDPA
jgi:CRP/FNR family cyclic AMP-dependent transcriptional regulator